MANKHGDFIWYELMANNADAAAAFYGPLLGWSVGNQPEYREIQAGDGEGVGGILALTPEMTSGGARPAWVGYIAVDDVDASVATIEAAGGRTYMPARDMAAIGRFAMVADPQGVPFYVMRPTPPADRPDAVSTAFAAEAPAEGHCAWNELSTTDPEAAMAFYNTAFGWVKDGEMEMGPLGKYEFLRHGFMLGAVMPKMPQQPAPAWTYYFRVPDIDAAVATIKESGGQILRGPDEIPGGEFSLNAMDPQGAAFGLVGKRS
jgi:uncharacterized protein